MFSVTQFESILEFVADALESGSDSQSHLVSLMRLSTLLLREAPESKIPLHRIVRPRF
jgi:hypothetical protein